MSEFVQGLKISKRFFIEYLKKKIKKLATGGVKDYFIGMTLSSFKEHFFFGCQ